ncbi:response regulator [Shewanella maritima]|uniref:response regulator n=1 Tax=Shewanella maritima TaxID=2520507 RepID=UPI003735456D
MAATLVFSQIAASLNNKRPKSLLLLSLVFLFSAIIPAHSQSTNDKLSDSDSLAAEQVDIPPSIDSQAINSPSQSRKTIEKFSSVEEALLTEVELLNIILDLKYLDEVLTASVLSYTFSGDERWLTRYYEFEPKLTAQANRLLENQYRDEQRYILEFQKVSDELFQLEDTAISMVKQGERQRGMSVLNSDEYHDAKARYMDLLIVLEREFKKRERASANKGGIALTAQEEQWLATHTVKIGIEDLPPILYLEDNGEIAGLAGVVVKQIIEKTGMKVEFVELPWETMLEQFRAGEIDVVPHSYLSEERKKYGQYSTPYYLVREVFFVKEENEQFQTAKDLALANIAVQAGYTTIDKILAVYPDITITEIQNVEEGIELVLNGVVDAILDSESVILDRIEKRNVTGLRLIDEDVISATSVHMLSNKQSPILGNILQKGLDTLKLKDLIITREDWFKSTAKSHQDVSRSSYSMTTIWRVIVIVVVLLIIMAWFMAKVFQASDKEIARKFGSKSFKQSLAWAQVFLCACLILLTSIVTQYAQQRSDETVEYNLQTLLNSTHDRLQGWVDLEMSSIALIGESPKFVDLVQQLLEVPADPKSLTGSALQAKIYDFIELRHGSSDSIGYFVISPEHISLASSRNSNIGSINVIQQARPELLKKVFAGENVFIPPIRSDVFLNDSRQHITRDLPPTMFFAVPVKDSAGNVIAVLTKRVDFNGAFSSILSAGFIGHSGETYALDKTGMLLSNVRFESELKEIGLIEPHQQASLNLRIANPGVDLLKFPQPANHNWPLTLMAAEIAKERAGINLNGYNDYRGQVVVGNWMWDDKLGLGIAAEMDVSEARQVNTIFKYTVWSMLCLSISAMFGTSLFTLRIASRATNSLKHVQSELEAQVNERTAELKLNSERTRTIIDNASDGIIVVNKKGIIQEFSPAATDIFGYSAKDMLGEPIENIMEQAFHELYQQRKSEAIEQHLILAITGYCKDGRNIEIEVAVGDAELAGEHLFTAIVRDATERKEAERELMLAKQKAEEATQAKSDFLANMSHEIRTPMNAIIGMSYLALQTGLNRKQSDYINKIQTSSESLLGIINDILDFSKIEAGKLDLEYIDFQLADTLDNLVQVVSQKSQQKGLELLVDVDPQLPLALIGDPLRLGQILLNLTNNAIKFTEQGEVIVKAELMFKTRDSVKVKFMISDTGIGMNEQQLSRLFQSFSQADASTTRKYGGTGLGLTICKTLTELMQGDIWVESEQGKGSQFYFTAQFKPSNMVTPQIDAIASSMEKLHVLIVDDSTAAREILLNICESLGFVTDIASSGSEALEKVAAADANGHPFGLVLADWKMPEMDGIEFGRQLQSDLSLRHQPHFIIITAYDRDDMIKLAKSIRLDASISKPVNASNLYDTVMRVMGNQVSSEVEQSSHLLDVSAAKGIVGAHVLLVEDYILNQEIATELLQLAGLEVSLANNGQEAVDAVKANHYDLVLMDIQMPVMDGFQATREIRQTGEFDDLPIIAMTANAMAGDKERCLEAGMNDHLPKPINPQQVYQTLAKWITPTGKTLDTPLQQSEINPKDVYIADFDTDAAIQRMGGSVKSYIKALKRVRETEADVIERVQQHLNDSDIRSAIIAIHSLKGIAGNIGAQYLFEPSNQLELTLNDLEKSDSEQLEKLKTDTEIAQQLQTIEKLVSKMVSEIDVALQSKWANSTSKPSPQLSVAEVIELCQSLMVQIDDFDSTAIDTFEQIEALIKDTSNSEFLQSVHNDLSNFDFDSAQDKVQQLQLSLQQHSASTQENIDITSELDKIDQMIASYDASILELVDDLLEQSVPEPQHQLLSKMRQVLELYDFDAAQEYATELRRELS